MIVLYSYEHGTREREREGEVDQIKQKKVGFKTFDLI